MDDLYAERRKQHNAGVGGNGSHSSGTGTERDFPPAVLWDWDGTGQDLFLFLYFLWEWDGRFESPFPCHPLVWICYYNSNEFTFKSWRQIHISLKQHSEEQIVPSQWDNNIWFPIKCSMNKTQNRKIANRCTEKVNYTTSFLFIFVILFRFLHCPKRSVLSKNKSYDSCVHSHTLIRVCA